MKDIAQQTHANLSWKRRFSVTVLVFSVVISATGLPLYTWIYDWKLTSTDPINAWLFGSIGISFLWSAVTAIIAVPLYSALRWGMELGWPRYFFYVFKFANDAQKPIVGWAQITFDPTDGTLHATGRSFDLSNGSDIDPETFVGWTSEIVTGGTYEGHPACYILYKLDEGQAIMRNRSYRNGLLRFRLLRLTDVKDNETLPDPLGRRADQYFGHQQAIDKDNIWNPAYAECAWPQEGIDVEIQKELTKNLNDGKERLVRILDSLQTTLRGKTP